MSVAIAIFVKTPALSPLKTRLAATISNDKAQEFYRLSLAAVQETVSHVDAHIYWAVAEENGLYDPLWQGFAAIHTGEGNLGARQHHIYETLLKKHEQVLLIGADAPQISRAILNDAIASLGTNNFVMGGARDGGYYLFGGRVSTEQQIWISVPWSTNITRDRLEAALADKPAQLQLLTDVDSESDLQQMISEMPKDISDEQEELRDWVEKLKF